MRANDKVADGAKDVEHGDMNRVVCGGIRGEDECVENVALKWGNDVLDGVLFAILVESMFRGETGQVPDATRTKCERDNLGKGGPFVSRTPPVYL